MWMWILMCVLVSTSGSSDPGNTKATIFGEYNVHHAIGSISTFNFGPTFSTGRTVTSSRSSRNKTVFFSQLKKTGDPLKGGFFNVCIRKLFLLFLSNLLITAKVLILIGCIITANIVQNFPPSRWLHNFSTITWNWSAFFHKEDDSFEGRYEISNEFYLTIPPLQVPSNSVNEN